MLVQAVIGLKMLRRVKLVGMRETRSRGTYRGAGKSKGATTAGTEKGTRGVDEFTRGEGEQSWIGEKQGQGCSRVFKGKYIPGKAGKGGRAGGIQRRSGPDTFLNVEKEPETA